MKNLLLGTVLLFSTQAAFAIDIKCESKDQKVKVSLLGIDVDQRKVATLKIFKKGWFGVNAEISNPDCEIKLIGPVRNVLADISCENEVVEALVEIKKPNFATAQYVGFKKIHALTCQPVID